MESLKPMLQILSRLSFPAGRVLLLPAFSSHPELGKAGTQSASPCLLPAPVSAEATPSLVS